MSVFDPLEPHSRAFMEALQRAGGKPLQELSVAEARRGMHNRQATPLAHPSITFETIEAAGVTVTIVRPAQLAGPLPAVLHMHGGGWVIGGIETHSRLVRELAIYSNAAIVFPHYALAPEFPYPVALDQCMAVLQWLRSEGASHAIDPARLAVSGDSAGGNLAAVIAMEDTAAASRLRLQALLCPIVLPPTDVGSYAEYANGLNLTRAGMHWFWDHYVPDASLRTNPRISPMLAGDDALAQAPPALIVTAECDVLRDEAEAYARRLVQLGVHVTAVRFLGTLHNFYLQDALANSGPTRSALHLIGNALKEALYS